MATLMRIYPDPADAAAVAAELEKGRYAPFTVAAGSNADATVAALMASKVHKPVAAQMAAQMTGNATLVGVHAMFGTGVEATRILESKDHLGVGRVETKPSVMIWDEATPMSCILQWPVLTSPHFSFSRTFGFGAELSKSKYTTGEPNLMKSAAPLSNAIMFPTLSKHPAPLSAMLFLPVLKKAG